GDAGGDAGGDTGGDAGGDAGGDDGGGSDVGTQCTSNDDCDVICLFAGDSDYGFCSVPCEDVFDCPDFWECVDVGNATLTYCAPG
ncbi:MAG: hypothetical protein H6712_31315, partial [Myxococcales bacterium]|nr:hypothetical protein [Myxococcales bacterium]